MTSYHLGIIVFVTSVLLAGCGGVSSAPKITQKSPVQISLEQCMAVQNNQSQSLSQLAHQVVELNTSLGLLTTAVAQQRESAVPVALACVPTEPSFARIIKADFKKSVEVNEVDLSKKMLAAEISKTVEPDATKLIVGREEKVWVQDLQLALPARVDTGAETASIDARDIELFERDGKSWVRFFILHPDTDEPLQLERLLKRQVSIIQANSTEAERRPVIELGIAIGSIKQTAEFTLSDRSHLNHQILIGRNILRDVMIVDVSQSNLAPYKVPEEREGAL